jgi:nitrogen-specific signal transduction histidine kinase
LNGTLERRVEERGRALEAEIAERRRMEGMVEQAQRLEAIGQLTGGVAHDFNNLLTVVIGQTESIILAAGDNERIVRMAQSAQRVAERGAQLTAQLLAFARRQRLHPEPVMLHRSMAATSELIRRAVGEAITLDVEADPDLWPSLVDPAQFESAVINLALNARDAMPEGGRLTIAMRNAAVAEVEARHLDLATGDYVVVSVADTGQGMSDEVKRHCFEPFYTTKDVGKGTGLGLSQVYGFTRQSGGTATVESVVGKGTTIAMYLPRTLVAAEEPAGRGEAVSEPGHGRIVLVVEDQDDVREVIEESLSQFGYRVLVARDGAEARDIIESGRPIDLLLTDVVMPNQMSGVDLARWARRTRQDLKIVLVSGYTRRMSTDDSEEFMFLEKPFRQADLARTVAAALAAA